MVFLISIDKSSRNTSAGKNGILKQVHGVNGLPISIAPGFPDLQDQFNQMGIQHIRLHDTFGIADIDDGFQVGRSSNQNQLMVNVPTAQKTKAQQFIADFVNKRTIFPYAAAGMRQNNLALAMQNANYKPTDSYLKRILDNDPSLNPKNIQRELVWRVGRTLDGGYEIPENFNIYATLVGEVVKRYAVNYQSIGLPRKVNYWEIWNEPDLTFFWNNNNPQVYYDFYSKIVRTIKSIDPSAKVGGCGVANGYNPGGAYIDGLLNYCRNTNTPIDFISWHYYGNLTADPQNIIDVGNSIQTALNKYGYSNIESLCTEWNSSPFGRTNILSNVQSATNAAYIASSLICMQYCKTDKAYYYRGDASSFGMFNDNPQPGNTAYKSFCTYAAQSFNLFSRLLETPYILNHDNGFNTGLITLAAENAQGNKLNILAANYQVDTTFTNGTSQQNMYQQYYLDSNRTANQLNDTWSKNQWFGGDDPNTKTFDNLVKQNTVVAQLPGNGTLRAKSRTYTQSNTGVGLKINNISTNFQGYKLSAYRIKEGGRLDRMTPEEVTSSINISMSNGTLNLTDTGATISTVTLYSIEFTNDSNGNNGGGNTGGNGNTGGENTNSVTYTVTLGAGNHSISELLPPNYTFAYSKVYDLTFLNNEYPTIYQCPGTNSYNKLKKMCETGNQANCSFVTNTPTWHFTPFISGNLYNSSDVKVGKFANGAGKYTITLKPHV